MAILPEFKIQSSPSTIINPKSYTLKEGLKVTDRTNEVAKIFFSGMDEETKLNTFGIRIGFYPVKVPYIKNWIDGDGKFLFYGSQHIELEFEADNEKLIKITETDAKASCIVYVDRVEFDNCYTIHNYKPQEISEEDMGERLKEVSKSNPQFKIEYAVYNSHGAGFFGSDSKEYQFFWSSPQEKTASRIDTLIERGMRDGGNIKVQTSNMDVRFEYVASTNQALLNGHPVKHYPLQKV